MLMRIDNGVFTLGFLKATVFLQWKVIVCAALRESINSYYATVNTFIQNTFVWRDHLPERSCKKLSWLLSAL